MRIAIAGAAVLCALPASLLAQGVSPVTVINADAARSDIVVQKVRGDISVLTGSGGNIGVLSTPEGKLLVDAGIAVSRVKISAALDRISPAPVKWLIDTHWHWDHTDGNEWLHETGATIVAHENTLKRLSEATRVEEWNFTFPAAPLGARPTVLFTASKTMTFGGNKLLLTHEGPGHTDTDLAVLFADADVLMLGDIFWNGVYPFIDYGTGGSIDDTIRWANLWIGRLTPKTIIVPGHGPVGSLADLVAYRDMLVAVRAAVAKLKSQGKSLAETVAAKPTAPFDAKWGGSVIGPEFFTRIVYAGLGARAQH